MNALNISLGIIYLCVGFTLLVKFKGNQNIFNRTDGNLLNGLAGITIVLFWPVDLLAIAVSKLGKWLES